MNIRKMPYLALKYLTRIYFRHFCLAVWGAKHFLQYHLQLFYFNWLGKWPNLRHPSDLNELLLGYSLKNVGNQLLIDCTDKYQVRRYVSQCGFPEILNELYGVYECVDDIDFDALPDKFVMKMNNASGRNYICTNKASAPLAEVKEHFSDWLKDRNFGLWSGEWQYSKIKPLIVVEKYLQNLSEKSLVDYKFHCFKGRVHSCFVGYNRSLENSHGDVCFDHYTLDWQRTEAIKPEWHVNRCVIQRPKTYETMLLIAGKLSEPFDYVRVDLYEVEGRVLFGELTFTPQGCIQEFYKQDFLTSCLLDVKAMNL